MRKFLAIILALQFLSGCKTEDPTISHFIGTWESQDGGIIKFDKNNSFYAENLIGQKMFDGFPSYYGKKINAKGKWTIDKKYGNWWISVDFEKIADSNGGHSMQLQIVKNDSLSKTKCPWTLVAWIGDPDDMNKYEFEKQ